MGIIDLKLIGILYNEGTECQNIGPEAQGMLEWVG